MAAGYSLSAIFNSVFNPHALTSGYTPVQMVRQAIPAAEGNVIIPKHTDLNKQLDILLSAAAQLGDENNFARQSLTEVPGCYVSSKVPQKNPCILNPSGQLNNPYNNFSTPSISGNYGPVDNSLPYLNSVPETVCHELPQCQLPMATSLYQGQQLLQDQQELLLLLQQNQLLIKLLQQVQPYSFQDCSKIPLASTANDSGASHSSRLAQIYADASRQTAMTDGLPFAQLNSELASLSQAPAKPRDGDQKLKQLFKRIDDMHAAMHRFEKEKARRQPKRSRYVRKSPPRLKLVPQAHEEYIFRPGRGRNDNDHQLSTAPLSCAYPVQAGLKKNSMTFVAYPCMSGATNLDYFITDGSMAHETGASNSSPTLQYVTLLQPAEKLAPAQENVLLTDSNNIKLESERAKNAPAHEMHEASKLKTASDLASIKQMQEDLLPDFDLISYLCSENSLRDDLKTLEDCINFLTKPVLNLEPSGQGGLSVIVNPCDGGPPTISCEMHNTPTTQPNSMTVLSNAFNSLEANDGILAPRGASGTKQVVVSAFGAEQDVVITCGAEQEVVSAYGPKQEVVSTCGAKQEDVITVLPADPYRTVPFPDKSELEDAAIRMKFSYDFDNPGGISVFTSCVGGSLEENRDLLENCKKVLFTRLVDPQASMARERELGYPDLTEVIMKIDELREAVGGYWPVSDMCAWMLGFLHPNELLYLKSLMDPEWKTKMDTATTTEDILVSAYLGLYEFLTRLGGNEETKQANDLSHDHNRVDTNGSGVELDKCNASFENGAEFQEQTSVQMKRKHEDDEDEMYLPPRKRPTIIDDGEFFF